MVDFCHSSRKDGLQYWGALGVAGYALAAPYFAARMLRSNKHRAGLRQRLTLYPPDVRDALAQPGTLWAHTVSVGELQAARPLLERIKRERPHIRLAVSTVTDTGQNLARQLDCVDASLYLPLDILALCRRAFEIVNPACLLILETELWPNFIRAAAQREVPAFLINARLSDKSFRHYRLARPLFRPLLQRFTSILAQSEVDRTRFLELGAYPERVHAAGNIKFDVAPQSDPTEERRRWRELFGLGEDDILLLGGSTFAGEEAILRRVVEAMRGEGLPARLLIAPRHVERVPAIQAELRGLGAEPVLRSSLSQANSTLNPGSPILLDTIGELRSVYAAADLVFIGKSLRERGGQNPIEPALYARPILFGPNMQNFRDIAAALLRDEAARAIHSESDLLAAARQLAQSPEERRGMGERARAVVDANRGALDRVFEALDPVLNERYPTPEEPNAHE